VSHIFSLTRCMAGWSSSLLSPLLFNIYVDSFLQRLQSSGAGCRIGLCYIGCVMYADDLTLFASSLCELQCMTDICVDKGTNLCMQFNSKKCSVIRFGPRYHSQCADVTMLGNSIKLINSVKLLGVQLFAYKKFRIDIGYMKHEVLSCF